MKAYASFDAFVNDQRPVARATLRRLRVLVAREAPQLVEAVKWGNGCWVSDEGPIAFAHVADDHVQFGFFLGAELDDPDGLLEGKGKFVRHAKLGAGADPSEAALARLLREAVRRGR